MRWTCEHFAFFIETACVERVSGYSDCVNGCLIIMYSRESERSICFVSCVHLRSAEFVVYIPNEIHGPNANRSLHTRVEINYLRKQNWNRFTDDGSEWGGRGGDHSHCYELYGFQTIWFLFYDFWCAFLLIFAINAYLMSITIWCRHCKRVKNGGERKRGGRESHINVSQTSSSECMSYKFFMLQ